MNKKRLFKGLFLILLLPSMMYYFLKTPGSEVTISSIFILIFTVLGIYDEMTLSKINSVKRKSYQIMIDRLFVLMLMIISLDVLFTFFTNGITL